MEEVRNRISITNIVNKSFSLIDQKKFGTHDLRAVFTDDVTIYRPNGTEISGVKNVSRSYTKSFSRFESTQHFLTGHEVDILGDKATVRVNLQAMHLWLGANEDATDPKKYFLAGAVITIQLTQVSTGWRIYEVINKKVWRSGAGFASMEKTDK